MKDAMNFEGSDAEKQARIYLATFGIDYDAITKEQFVNIIDVLKLSKYMKSSTNQRGKARPIPAAWKRETETQISKKNAISSY